MRNFIKKNSGWFINYALFIVFGFLAVYMIDSKNYGRPSFFNDNIFSAIVRFFGKDTFDVIGRCYKLLFVYIVILSIVFLGYRILMYFASKKVNKLFLNLAYPIICLAITIVFIACNIHHDRVFLTFIVFGICCCVGIYMAIFTIHYFLGFFRKDKREGNQVVFSDKNEKEETLIFPALQKIDKKYSHFDNKSRGNTNISLLEFVNCFQDYLSNHHLYFDISYLRFFISGMAISRLIILEGLSGTGKTTLPRMFAKFMDTECYIEPIQSTFRDRTDLVGYYSDLAGQYKETNFLKRLYEASYRKNEINVMVLDEMNLSRIEYYFADFLSVLEGPSEEWRINLLPTVNNEGPDRLDDGSVIIPTNTWFFGTANKDDSTYLITDKVYDRAMVIDFETRSNPLTIKNEAKKISITYSELIKLFNEAQVNPNNLLNERERLNFQSICDFVKDNFDLVFGNRIMKQIIGIVPVYVQTGGTKEEVLDLMFANKLLRKLEGRYESYLVSGLNQLLQLIDEKYGPESFNKTRRMIEKYLRKLN